MKRSSTVIITAAAVAATLSAGPAFAQNHQERHDRQPSAQARSEGQRAAPNRVAPREEVRRDDGRAVVGRAVERPTVVRPQVVRPEVVRPQVIRPEVVRPRVATPYYGRPYYAQPHYARPYYAQPYYARPYVFRPHLHLGFGIVVGYPVPYAYAYPYPVPVYGYAAPPAPVIVGPSSTQYGGVSLEISPSDAAVYVDGGYAGLVRDFDGTRQTLTLANGRHRVEISAPGYEPMTIDVDVVPGQIVPYQGSLQPARY